MRKGRLELNGYDLKSRFALLLAGMSEIKHNAGFSLKYMDSHIVEFDRFCYDRFPEKSLLDHDLVEEWVHSSPTESLQEIDKRYRTMKHLGEHMLSLGLPAYISNARVKRRVPAEPHIFTDAQLAEFFRVCDSYPKAAFPAYRHILLPVMFRVIYCCGLRNSEACNLKRMDVNLVGGCIRIEHSKGVKDRVVYMSNDLSRLCERYDTEMDRLLPDREYYFPSEHDKHFLNTSLCRTFNHILTQTSFYGMTSKKPTCNSLRHTFAVNSMRQCLRRGGDFDVYIQYLSKYMGHASPQETMYYLHLSVNLAHEIREISKGFEDVMGGVWTVEE